MHKISLDPEVLRRVSAWRDVEHVFQQINPAKTAHLVIDMQNAFTASGSEMEVPVAREIVPNINRISRAVRAAGGANLFARMTIDAETEKNWSVWLRYFCDAKRSEATREALRHGSEEHALDPGLEVLDVDVLFDKRRYSPLVPGASNLQTMLIERGIDTLIITGTVTNCCCESTARDAMQMDYRVIFISDATAALSDSDHNASLNNMVSIFADVMSTSEVVKFLERSADVRPAATG